MEVFVIVIPPFIALLIGAWAILAPQPVNVAAEQMQLAEHIAWLEERQRHAEQQNWDELMQAQLADQLADARRRLARLG